MPALTYTWGATIVVGTSASEYVGLNNQFFGGSSDRIAMLRYSAPGALGANDVLTAADFTGYFKADTTGDSDNITIGLISSGWVDSTTNFNTLYSYITGTVVSAALSTTTTEAQKILAITSLLQVWAANPSAYSGIYFRKSTMTLTRIGATSQAINTSITTRTACSAPVSVSLGKATADPGEAVNLLWSGEGAGTLNPIIGYIIQRSENGGAWVNWTTAGASPLAVAAHSSWGSYYDYRVITDGQYIDSGASTATARLTTRYPTACGAPTTGSVSPTLAETNPTLTWAGAAPGTLNAISAYEIEYAEAVDNAAWGAWTALKVVNSTATSGSTDVALPSARASYRKYRIRARGAAGATYYSAWKDTNSIRYNSLPTAPTAFSAAPVVFVSGDITLMYSGATDPDNNISTYNVWYAVATDGVNYGGWTALANGSTIHTGVVLTAGALIKYRVRTVDALGAVSGFIESNSCGKNTAPAAPTVSLPQDSKTTHNSRPRFLITMNADPESHLQAVTAAGYTASRSTNLASGNKILLRKTAAAAAGTVTLSITSADIYGEASGAAARNTTYAAPSYTDDPITKGTSQIKAAHITELRSMLNTVRAFYGMAAASWAEVITAGVTSTRNWVAHILELRAAVDEVIALVNGWDTASVANRIPAPTWITLTNGVPRADAMEQIRDAIESL